MAKAIDPLASSALELAEDHKPESLEIVTRNPSFYSDHIVFQVGMQLFKVPRRKFEDGSEVFRNMFAMPPGEGVVEGQTDEHPLLLESISMDEFRALLHIMFTPLYGPSEEETKTLSVVEWIHVLKLATMWSFHSLRQAAINALTPLLEQGDPVQWVTLARKYEVRTWLLPALHALARREKGVQMDEAEVLGMITVVKMAEVRENFPFGVRGRRYYSSAERVNHDFEPEIVRLFGEEIREEVIEPSFFD